MRKFSMGLICLIAIALMAGPAMAGKIKPHFGFQNYPVGSDLDSNAGWDCWGVGVTNNTANVSCANQFDNGAPSGNGVAIPIMSADPLGSGVVAGPSNSDRAVAAADWASGASILLPGAAAMVDPTDPSTAVGATGEILIRTEQVVQSGTNIMSTFAGGYHGGTWQGHFEMKLDAFGSVVWSAPFGTQKGPHTLGTVAELSGHRLQFDYLLNANTNTVVNVTVVDLDEDYTSTSSGFYGQDKYTLNGAVPGLNVGLSGVTHFGFHNCCSSSTGNTYKIVPIPEPGTIALLGLGGLAVLLRRRRRA